MSLMLLASLSLNAQTFQVNPAYVRTSVEGIDLLFEDGNFAVHKEGNIAEIRRCDVAPELRNMTPEQVESYVTMGKFQVKQFDNGEFSVQPSGGLDGGGPLAALATAIAVRTVGWSVAGALFVFVPGGQGPAVYLLGITENVATVATSVAAVTPTL